ncbi:MAG TPA: hypothetical protein VE093_41275 [Polyangiaceae bacterium]|nr:hypothetical protein [Polyangiaceae bacterium]
MRPSKILRLCSAFLLAALSSIGLIHCGGDESAAECESPSGAAAPASIDFGAACCADADCKTGTCATFANKGTGCSKACSADADCEGLNPGGANLGCGGQGVCKIP